MSALEDQLRRAIESRRSRMNPDREQEEAVENAILEQIKTSVAVDGSIGGEGKTTATQQHAAPSLPPPPPPFVQSRQQARESIKQVVEGARDECKKAGIDVTEPVEREIDAALEVIDDEHASVEAFLGAVKRLANTLKTICEWLAVVPAALPVAVALKTAASVIVAAVDTVSSLKGQERDAVFGFIASVLAAVESIVERVRKLRKIEVPNRVVDASDKSIVKTVAADADAEVDS